MSFDKDPYADEEAEGQRRRRDVKRLAKEAVRNDKDEPASEIEIFGEPEAPNTNDTTAD